MMVAYSFQPRFIAPILSGRKQQTIRAIGRRKHVCIGDRLQLYTGMRTKRCRLIATAECAAVYEIDILFDDEPEYEGVISRPPLLLLLDEFARRDGFTDWPEMKGFWREHHPEAVTGGEFKGMLICWGPLIEVNAGFSLPAAVRADESELADR